METPRRLSATHSILYQAPRGIPHRYFGWPSVARLADGSLLAAASGFRLGHNCAFGRTVIWHSQDEGRTWSMPRVLNDSPLDDRDAGVVALPGGGAMVSWFSSDIRIFRESMSMSDQIWKDSLLLFNAYDEEIVQRTLGSVVRRILPDGTAEAPIPVQVTSPHGPIVLHDGSLFYVGTPFGKFDYEGKLHFSMETLIKENYVLALRSDDLGRTWRQLGELRPPKACESHDLEYEAYLRGLGQQVGDGVSFYEPHAVELPDGRILCAIRVQYGKTWQESGTWLSDSSDGGLTWSAPRPLINDTGLPPHLLRHSSGVIVLTYGYRREPFGQRVAFSLDDGKTWQTDWILRDDAPIPDLGYPATTELSDGSLYTVYYQLLPEDRDEHGYFCSILASHWTLPEF